MHIYIPRASKSQNILVDALCTTFSDRYSKKWTFESFQIVLSQNHAFHRKVGDPIIEGQDLAP